MAVQQIYEDPSRRLTDSYYGKKIYSAYLAYGGELGFCRFYSCGEGTVHLYRSSMVIDGAVDPEDISTLVRMTKPLNIEVSGDTSLKPDGYKAMRRTLFGAVPKESGSTEYLNVTCHKDMEKCFEILSEGFENMGRFDEWYVDISHRVRHGISELYLSGGTTVTKSFEAGGFVFLSHIATARDGRGKGGARRLLYRLAEKFEGEGKAAYLFAFDYRKSFYEAIGFKPAAEDIYYQLQGER